MSSAIPAEAPATAKVTVWAKMPAIRNCVYASALAVVPGIWIAPPMTYENSRTNITGCIRPKTTISGMRVIRRRLRLATTQESCSVAATP